jgi:hypothetical protein
MASAKLVRALAEGKVTIQKAPKIGGEVMLTYRPLMNRQTGKIEQPASVTLSTFRPFEPLKRSDVTIDHLRNSNLEDLVRRGAIVLL